MKNLKNILGFVLSFALCAVSAQAQSPKQEWRGVWFQTVWAGDWPKSYSPTTQRNEFIQHLGRFEKLGINAVCFQVRSMCDAFYDSQYEPWSQWMTGTRGQAPDYDPFAYLIEQAHARGMEVHAWINPYRFASSSTYTQHADDYSVTHPEWVKYCDEAGIYILNPSDPAVRQQIVRVIEDIVEHYDVDGIIFDDYFYQNGYKDSYDDAFYAANNPEGLSRADWRRHQVNLMVQDVHNAIKAIKPWCRFGIGPAGVAASDPKVAAKYGIPPSPGSDWQYDGIYSEPIQWYVDHSIDYMSPQVYWPINWSAGDYKLLTPWWYNVAHHFGRHCYISQSLSGLQTTVKNKPMTTITQSSFDAYEINRQLEINYASTLDGVSGMQFFNASGFKKTNFINVVTAEEWTNKAKVPAMTWYKTDPLGLVSNLNVNAQTLTWNYSGSNVRYGIYAIPVAHRHDADIISSSKYYLGMAYDKQFTLPDSVSPSTHAIAVTVIDRYANEWSPRFYGEAQGQTVTPVLSFPQNAASIMLPTTLTWQPVADATGYTVQVSAQSDFSQILVQNQVGTNEMNTNAFENLRENKTYYWRVCAQVANAQSNWSATWSFTGHPFSILSPADGDSSVSVTPTIEWENAGAGLQYELEIASSSLFGSTQIIYADITSATSMTIPVNVLAYNTTYYARVKTQEDKVVSLVSSFTTEKVNFVPPVIVSPTDGGVLVYPTVRLECSLVPNNGFKFELSTRSDFPARGGYTKRLSTEIGINVVEFEDMTSGTYYARAATKTSATKTTEYGDAICFTYTVGSGISDVKLLEQTGVQKIMTKQGIKVLKNGQVYNLLGTFEK